MFHHHHQLRHHLTPLSLSPKTLSLKKNMDDEICYSPSFKHKLKTSLCLSPGGSTSPEKHTRLHRTSSPTWLRSKAHELSEIKDKCQNLISRIGRSRRTQSADFRYDPGSYRLNFDEGYDDSHVEDCPLKNFSSRLLPSSPRVAEKLVAPPEVVVSRRIAAIS